MRESQVWNKRHRAAVTKENIQHDENGLFIYVYGGNQDKKFGAATPPKEADDSSADQVS